MTQTINFLPQAVVEKQRQQRQLYRHAAALGLVLLVLAGGHWAMVERNAHLRVQAQAVEEEVRNVKVQADQAAGLRGEEVELNRRVLVQRAMTPGLTMAQLLAVVGQALPDSANFLSISLEETDAGKSAPGPAPARRAATTDPVAPPRPQLLVRMVGLAPSDVEVSAFFSSMAQSPLLTDAKLLYSRPLTLNHLLGREFLVEVHAPLDVRVEPVAAPARQGVADAH